MTIGPIYFHWVIPFGFVLYAAWLTWRFHRIPVRYPMNMIYYKMMGYSHFRSVVAIMFNSHDEGTGHILPTCEYVSGERCVCGYEGPCKR